MRGKGKVERESLNILIVEDDQHHKELITEAIKEANHSNEIVWFEKGGESLEYLKNGSECEDDKKWMKPDLILLDLRLPDMDGKEVLRQIKSDQKMRVIPVIILTASAHERDVSECYKLGASGYVTKPVAFDDFVAIVRTIPFYWTFVNTLPKV